MIKKLIIKLYKKFKHSTIKNSLIYNLYSENFFLRFFFILAGLKLKKLRATCKSIENYIDLALTYNYKIFKVAPIVYLKSLQKKSEITEFCKLILPIRSRVILEIGTHNGGTLFLLSRFSSSDALIISIDLPRGSYGGGYPSVVIPFYKFFAINNQKIVLIRKDSHKQSTLQKIKKILKNRQIDILFIDGDHTYKGVKRDFQMYSPLVKKNGIIVFHDIVQVPPEIALNVDVNKFWNEIKKDFDYKEIVENWNQGHYGIGIIEKK